MGILLVLGKKPVVDIIKVLRKFITSPYRLTIKNNSTDLTVCYPNLLELCENKLEIIGH